jgi:(2Fe-2S) ferredoxin
LAKYERHLFVCTNQRPEGSPRPSCNPDGKAELHRALNLAVAEAGLKGRVRVNKSGCLDQCEHAANVVVYPEAVWYGNVQLADVPEIVQSHLIEGRPVARLELAEECIHTASCPHRAAKS